MKRQKLTLYYLVREVYSICRRGDARPYVGGWIWAIKTAEGRRKRITFYGVKNANPSIVIKESQLRVPLQEFSDDYLKPELGEAPKLHFCAPPNSYLGLSPFFEEDYLWVQPEVEAVP